ncbi:hypothetical protein ABH926_008489 [Catenulispora sp. GP43]
MRRGLLLLEGGVSGDALDAVSVFGRAFVRRSISRVEYERWKCFGSDSVRPTNQTMAST